MRTLLVAAALAAGLAVPASAQGPRPSDRVREYAPAMDRMANALLNLDLGPVLDAADPYRPHRDRSLRDIARRDDPYFEQRMRGTIYGSAAAIGQAADAMAAMEPVLRGAIAQMEASMAQAIEVPPLPPGNADDDWDIDVDEDGPDEPYEN